MSLKNILGQNKAINLLKNQIIRNRLAHSYIFLGQRGVGRKKTAIELSKILNCYSGSNIDCCDSCISCQKIDKLIHPDLHIIDFEWQRKILEEKILSNVLKIDAIRAMQKEINLKPYEGRYKTFIIEPAERLNIDAANCLLKTLEEPPENSIIILITTTLESLPKTIISRCQKIKFENLNNDIIKKILGYNIEDEILNLSNGSIEKAKLLVDSINIETGIKYQIDFFNKLVKNQIQISEIVELVTKINESKNSVEEFVNNLIYIVREHFSNKIQYLETMEFILNSKKELRYNINTEIFLQNLLLQLYKKFVC